MERCYCALGGNLGPVNKVFDLVLTELGEHPALKVVAVSRYHRTAAVGAAAEVGGDFLNAVVAIDTDLAPLELLDLLQHLENQHGRVREVYWGPRTLDLDVLFYGDQIVDLPRLIVPHPGAWYRRFVLDPMCDIAPDFQHPVKKLTMRTLRERLLPRPLQVALAGGTESQRQDLINQLQREFPKVKIASWQSSTQKRSCATEPALLVWLGDSPDDDCRFDDLPLVPTIAATLPPEEFVRNLLRAALGS